MAARPNGKKWIDLISGVSVSNVGHNNPAVIEAVCSQARDYLHLMVYGEVIQSPQVRYAARIAELLRPDCNRSTSSIRAAKRSKGRIKLANATRAAPN